MPPTRGNGKICYIQIPATDIACSAGFYQKVFGWNIRQRGDGATAFDDGVGEVSGEWVVGRPLSTQPGLLIYIMVDSVAATVDSILAKWGRDCAADWRGCARGYSSISGSGGECAGGLSGAGVRAVCLA